MPENIQRVDDVTLQHMSELMSRLPHRGTWKVDQRGGNAQLVAKDPSQVVVILAQSDYEEIAELALFSGRHLSSLLAEIREHRKEEQLRCLKTSSTPPTPGQNATS